MGCSGCKNFTYFGEVYHQLLNIVWALFLNVQIWTVAVQTRGLTLTLEFEEAHNNKVVVFPMMYMLSKFENIWTTGL